MSASAAGGGWLRRVSALSNHRYSTWALAGIAFADSSFLPVPPDLLLVPMVLLRPERAYFLLAICIVASTLGAVVGYLIGFWLWSIIGLPMVEFYGYEAAFTAYQHMVEDWGFWFIIAAVLGRALHFAMVGTLLVLYGGKILAVVARYERPFAVISVLVLIGLFVAFHMR